MLSLLAITLLTSPNASSQPAGDVSTAARAAPLSASELAWVRSLIPPFADYRPPPPNDLLRRWLPKEGVLWTKQDGACVELDLGPGPTVSLETCRDGYGPASRERTPLAVGIELRPEVGEPWYLLEVSGDKARFVDRVWDPAVLCFGSSESTRTCEDGRKKHCNICETLRFSGGKTFWSQPAMPIVADFTKTCADPCPRGIPMSDMPRFDAVLEGRAWRHVDDEGPSLYRTRAACEADKKATYEIQIADRQSASACWPRRCRVGGQSCEDYEVCARAAGDKQTRCHSLPEPSAALYRLPLAAPDGARCIRPSARDPDLTRHLALDLATVGDKPSAVVAARDGEVTGLESSCKKGQPSCGGGLGNWVIVDHGGGEVTVYGHLERVDARLGDQVLAGTPLGREGATGAATSRRLHFRVHRLSAQTPMTRGQPPNDPAISFELRSYDPTYAQELSRSSESLRCAEGETLFAAPSPGQRSE